MFIPHFVLKFHLNRVIVCKHCVVRSTHYRISFGHFNIFIYKFIASFLCCCFTYNNRFDISPTKTTRTTKNELLYLDINTYPEALFDMMIFVVYFCIVHVINTLNVNVNYGLASKKIN